MSYHGGPVNITDLARLYAQAGLGVAEVGTEHLYVWVKAADLVYEEKLKAAGIAGPAGIVEVWRKEGTAK